MLKNIFLGNGKSKAIPLGMANMSFFEIPYLIGSNFLFTFTGSSPKALHIK